MVRLWARVRVRVKVRVKVRVRVRVRFRVRVRVRIEVTGLGLRLRARDRVECSDERVYLQTKRRVGRPRSRDEGKCKRRIAICGAVYNVVLHI